MKHLCLLLVMLAACGAKVVVDSPGGSDGTAGQGAAGPGSGGQTGIGGADTGTGGGVGTSGTGPVLGCQISTCSVGANEACACIGACGDGSKASASCPGGGNKCTCSLQGTDTAMIGTCVPGVESNPCDFVAGCCAQFF